MEILLLSCGTPLIVVAILIKATQAPRRLRERGLRLGSFIRCPHCNSLVPGDAVQCAYCQANLDELVTPLRVYRPDYEGHEAVAACIRCGRLNGPKWTECKHCHAPLERPAKP